MRFQFRLIVIFAALSLILSCSQKPDKITEQLNVIKEGKWPPDLENVQVDLEEVSQKNYYIIFDGSGSMAGRKVIEAKKALKRFIQLIPVGANIGLTVFDSSGNFERAEIGSGIDKIIGKIDSIRAGGNTPLGKSVEIAHIKLGIQAKKQLGYGDYNIVIITDGQATDERKLKKAVKRMLSESPIVIHTIGFKIGTGHPLNQPGKIYYKTAQNIDELSRGLEEVLAEAEDFTVKEF